MPICFRPCRLLEAAHLGVPRPPADTARTSVPSGWLLSWVRLRGRCSVINPSVATACKAPLGCDIFQHRSRHELASILTANQGSRRGSTPACLLMAFSIKMEPPRYKIATPIGISMNTEDGQADSRWPLNTVLLNYDMPECSFGTAFRVEKHATEPASRTSLRNRQDFTFLSLNIVSVGELPKLVNNRTQNDYV